jgi:hypothetical protein
LSLAPALTAARRAARVAAGEFSGVALASAIIARRRPWVAAVAIVLVVWSGSVILLTGRFLPFL